MFGEVGRVPRGHVLTTVISTTPNTHVGAPILAAISRDRFKTA